MRVTKRQLKNIIKEEIEAALSERGGDDLAAAKQMAQAFSKDPTIMAAVEKAAADPEVQAAVQEKEAELSEELTPDQKFGGNMAAGGAATAAGTLLATSPLVYTAGVASLPLVTAVGVTGGVALMAMGILILATMGKDNIYKQ